MESLWPRQAGCGSLTQFGSKAPPKNLYSHANTLIDVFAAACCHALYIAGRGGGCCFYSNQCAGTSKCGSDSRQGRRRNLDPKFVAGGNPRRCGGPQSALSRVL